jgi:hypothetical protein
VRTAPLLDDQLARDPGEGEPSAKAGDAARYAAGIEHAGAYAGHVDRFV